jgi:hypothetical protein
MISRQPPGRSHHKRGSDVLERLDSEVASNSVGGTVKNAFVSGIALLVVSTGLIACGGGGATTTVVQTESADTTESEGLTPVDTPITQRTVEACLEDGDAIIESSGPLNPDRSSPINAESVFAIGPDGGRIGVAIAEHAWIAKRLSRELAGEAEYEVSLSQDEKVVVIFDKGGPSTEDEELTNKCVEGEG